MQINRPQTQISTLRPQPQAAPSEQMPDIDFASRITPGRSTNHLNSQSSDDLLLTYSQNPYWNITRHSLHSAAVQKQQGAPQTGGSM